jgi:hypothetical protein
MISGGVTKHLASCKVKKHFVFHWTLILCDVKPSMCVCV